MSGSGTSAAARRVNRAANGVLAGACVLAVIVGAERLRSAWELPGGRYLLIHADDAGLCASANRGTITAMERGVVSSASIMVPCPGFEEFAKYAREHPEKDFGLHITLTSEWDDLRWGPVAGRDAAPSLVGADGTFRRTADEFALHADIGDVETEIRAQIEKARAAGITLSHLDNHMNSLFRRADLLELYVRISVEESLPVRFAKNLPDGWKDVLPADAVDAYYAQLKVLYTHRHPLFDVIDGDNYQVPAGEKRAYFLQALRSLRPGVTEFVLHCCDPAGDDWIPPDGERRRADASVFCSPEIARELEVLGIRVIDWKDFHLMAGQTVREHW